MYSGKTKNIVKCLSLLSSAAGGLGDPGATHSAVKTASKDIVTPFSGIWCFIIEVDDTLIIKVHSHCCLYIS